MFHLLDHVSYLGIIVFLVLTGMGLPIPEEAAVVAAGILSASGTLKPELAFASCLIGGLMGDSVMYFLGRHFGRSILEEHPRFTGFLTPDREARIEKMIERHAFWAMFVARFVVGLRSPMYLTAGILRVPFRRFLIIDAVCATIVIGMFFGLSYRYGDRVVAWIRGSQISVTLVLLILVAIVVTVIYSRGRRRVELQNVRKGEVGSQPGLATNNADAKPGEPPRKQSLSV
jgi:membrane protein DedA with SNARE-associated domain